MKYTTLLMTILMLCLPAISYAQERGSFNALEWQMGAHSSLEGRPGTGLGKHANYLKGSSRALDDENTVSRLAEQIGENVVEVGRSTLEYELESALTESVRAGVRSLIR